MLFRQYSLDLFWRELRQAAQWNCDRSANREQIRPKQFASRERREGFPSKSSKSLWPSSSQKILPLKLWNCIRWKVPLRLVSNYCALLVVLRSFPTQDFHIYCHVRCTTNCSKRISASTLNCPRLWNRFLSLFLMIGEKHKTQSHMFHRNILILSMETPRINYFGITSW